MAAAWMNYELWDVEAGRGLARYGSEDEALALVRSLIERFGVGYADDLELAVEHDDGTTVEMLAGSALVARAQAAGVSHR